MCALRNRKLGQFTNNDKACECWTKNNSHWQNNCANYCVILNHKKWFIVVIQDIFLLQQAKTISKVDGKLKLNQTLILVDRRTSSLFHCDYSIKKFKGVHKELYWFSQFKTFQHHPEQSFIFSWLIFEVNRQVFHQLLKQLLQITFPSMFANALTSHMVTAFTMSQVTITLIGATKTKLTSVTWNFTSLTLPTCCTTAFTWKIHP